MERSKRNKSRQTNKSRGNNANTNEKTAKEQNSPSSNSTQEQQQGGSGGIVRSKPCREIYRPPNCRRSRNNNNHSSNPNNPQNYYSYTSSTANNSDNLLVNGNPNPNNPTAYEGLQIISKTSMGASALATKPTNTNSKSESQNLSSITQGFRALNIHAKEFHFKPATFAASDEITSEEMNKSPPYYGIVSNTTVSDIAIPSSEQQEQVVSNNGPNFYSLCQSKSSGNISESSSMGLYGQNQGEYPEISGHPFASAFQPYSRDGFEGATTMSNRIQQSKSSGNIPGRSKVVRFLDDEESGRFDNFFVANSPKIGGEKTNPMSAYDFPEVNTRPVLQKSRTTVSMGMTSPLNPPQQGTSQFPNYFFRNYQRLSAPPNSPFLLQSENFNRIPNNPILTSNNVLPGGAPLKRSKSFNAKPQVQNRNFEAFHFGSNFDDFCIKKWPKGIQDSITLAVTGGNNIPPRHRISMVTSIFEKLFETRNPDKNFNDRSDPMERNKLYSSAASDNVELIAPAVRIFLYFIQRERDRTVMESLLNSCFATFQSLSIAHGLLPGCGNPQLKNKWNIFLSFLCTFYCQVKVIRIHQQNFGCFVTADQISFTILTLLCDSCIATLRSLPSCHSPETMDCLFTVMTSIGREMEKTFPPKMKQILTSVRDALLGLGPYSGLTEAPPLVQKTLMQLIELHAANWQLPASAVRYYYAHPQSASKLHNFETSQNP